MLNAHETTPTADISTARTHNEEGEQRGPSGRSAGEGKPQTVRIDVNHEPRQRVAQRQKATATMSDVYETMNG